jgi:hypothetical protein
MVILPVTVTQQWGVLRTDSYYSRSSEASRYRARTQHLEIGPNNDQGRYDLGNPRV